VRESRSRQSHQCAHACRMAVQMASDDNLKTGGAALEDSSIGRVYCSLTARGGHQHPRDPLDHRNGGHKTTPST
jgi:hypothetical protein